MPRARSVATVLAAAAFAVPGAAFGQGSSGAGDDQYADPFANGNGQSTSGSQTSGGSSDNGLTQTPNLSSGSSSGSSTSSGTSVTPTTTGTTSGSLPNTGSDPRLIMLAGLALLLAGAGLRLRTADEKF
jgi:LPXTG-motif cell wall-anchored protein